MKGFILLFFVILLVRLYLIRFYKNEKMNLSEERKLQILDYTENLSIMKYMIPLLVGFPVLNLFFQWLNIFIVSLICYIVVLILYVSNIIIYIRFFYKMNYPRNYVKWYIITRILSIIETIALITSGLLFLGNVR